MQGTCIKILKILPSSSQQKLKMEAAIWYLPKHTATYTKRLHLRTTQFRDRNLRWRIWNGRIFTSSFV